MFSSLSSTSSVGIPNIWHASLTATTHSAYTFMSCHYKPWISLLNISNCFTSPYCICKVRTVFLHSYVFRFIKTELHEPFYHPGVLFKVTKCLTMISSFLCPEELASITSALGHATLKKPEPDLSLTQKRYCINICFQWWFTELCINYFLSNFILFLKNQFVNVRYTIFPDIL